MTITITITVMRKLGLDFVTDSQTDKFFDTINGVCGFFLSVKFTTSLLASLAGG